MEPIDENPMSADVLRKKTYGIIRNVTSELASGNTKKYSNYVNMGILSEQYNIDQTMMACAMLKEIDDQPAVDLKKVFNIKLVNQLEAQETEWEVNAEFRNAAFDP